jgi:hypothetical protein
MSFCAPTPITAPTFGAPVTTPIVAAPTVAAPTAFNTVAPAVPPVPCQPELGEG